MSNRNRLTVELSYNNRLHHGVRLLPHQWIEIYGPTVAVEVMVHPNMARSLKEAGKSVPESVIGDAMIDSGAQATTIDTSVAERLQLPRTSKIEAFGIGGRSEGYTSPCSIFIPSLKLTTNCARAHCHELTKNAKHIIALIGRDILKQMTFFYDGINGQVQLVYPLPFGVVPRKGSTDAQKQARQRKRRR